MKKYLFFIIALAVSSTTCSQSANWSAVLPAKFPTNVSGQIHGISRVSQLKFHTTNAAKMYAVSARGGLFITTDTGTNWTLASGCDNLPNGTRLASVCIDYTNDNIIYLGTGDHNYYSSGRGVYKSTDGGLTFTATTLTGKIVVDMIMDPLNNNIIVAATNTGIYKTTNGGSTWVLKTASLLLDDLKQKHPNSRTLFTASNASEFYKSDDFGDTWQQVTNGIVLPTGVTSGAGCRIAVTPADTSIVYLGMIANGGMLYKSTDGGNNFIAVKTTASPYLSYYDDASTSSGQGDYNFGLGVDRNNASIVYFVAHCVWKSTNSGSNWTKLTNWWAGCHTDMHQIVTNPYNNSKLYNVNDGGIFLSNDGGTNWTPKSDGMYGYEIYHGNCSPTRRDMISIGTQDNGELYATSSGWFTNRGGDWTSQCAFDYRTNSSMVYYYGNNKRRLVNGSDATYNLPANITTLQDIAFNRKNSNLAFVANMDIYRTNNLSASTPTWTKISSFNKTIKSIHSSLADTNKLYVITNDGYIYISNDVLNSNPTFTAFALPNTTNNAASITSIPNNANTLYVTLNTKVYKSTDNGVSWINITYNLPATNHIKVICDEYFPANETIMLATGNAIYYKTATANTWTIYNNNLPLRTNLVDMSIYNDGTNNTLLRATTYGRGMWETNINNLRTITPSFSVSNALPCLGTSVQFTDNSTGNVTSRNWSFPGGYPSSSTDAMPVVFYNTVGIYNVSLTVSDGVNSSTATQSNYINTYGSNLPINEGFEGTQDLPTNWKNIDNGTQNNLWLKTTTAGGFGLSASSMMFDNYSWNIPGQKDELQTARYNAKGFSSVNLSFDVAYQQYTGYSDSLAVFVSTDCGNTYTKIYQKGGAILSTSGTSTIEFIPSATQWRNETLSLNSYIGNDLVFKFQNIAGFGNNIYLDNINITGSVVANAGSDISICHNDSASIGTAAIEGLSYSWSPSTGLSNAFVSNPKASPNSTTTYVLTTTQTLSGISSIDTVVVTVKEKTVSINYATICNTQLPYNWNGQTFTASGIYIVHLTNSLGCDSAATLNLSVISPASPIIKNSLGVAITSATMCTHSGTLNVYGNGAGVWSSSNTLIASVSTNGVITAISNGVAHIKYTVANASNCPSEAVLVVTVSAVSVPNAITGNTNLCVGSSTIYTTTSSGGVWSTLGRANINNVGLATGTSAGNTSIKYTITNAEGCAASTLLNITVNPQPSIPSISFATGTTGVTGSGGYCKNKTFTLVGTPNGGIWRSTGVITISSNGIVNTGNTLGACSVSYTISDAKNCSSSRTINSSIVSCAAKGSYSQPINSLNNFIIYPNPAHSILNIKVDNLVGNGKLELTDTYGKQVKVQKLSMGINAINVLNITKGVYILSVITEQGTQTQKIIIN